MRSNRDHFRRTRRIEHRKQGRCVSSLMALVIGLSLAAPSSAWAGGPVSAGVGLIAGVGGNFLNKPGDMTYLNTNGQRLTDTTYPGFGGFSAGIGLMGEVRFLGIVGLEIDAFRSGDRGSGTVTINGKDFSIEIGQSAWHIPVLLKGTLPLPGVAPFLVFGPEFVLPGSGTATINPPSGYAAVSTNADNYTMITLGLGAEVKLPVPAVDLRIPFSLRGSVTPSLSDKLGDRVQYSGPDSINATGIAYQSQWKYRALLTVGVAAYF